MTTARAGKSVLLDVKGLKKYFPIRRGLLQKTVGLVKAVDDVTFFLNQGETLSLVGESGSEKPRRPAVSCEPLHRRLVRFF